MPKHGDFMDIADILNDYSKEIYDEMHDVAVQVAKEGVTRLKQTSPKKTGDYSKGWRVKEFKGMFSFSNVIHNATDWRLTHLLEKPHAKRNGGITTPKVHIRPVEQECINEYQKDVVNIIKKGA